MSGARWTALGVLVGGLFGAPLVASIAGVGRSPPAAAIEPAAIAPAAPFSKSLLLFTWDTTRADRIGAYGSKSARTPGFDALAGRGVLYEHAYAPAPVTLPSHTSILTGVYPSAHGVRDNAIFRVDATARLFSEVLHDAGFKTGAFVGTFILDAKFGLNQGFDAYEAPDPSQVGLGWNVIERPAPMVTESALRFIDTLKPDQRFFLWVHYYDPHAPHEALPGELQPGCDDYDAEIARCDLQARRILDRLQARGLTDGLLTVITADHGESHGDHGELTHGNFLYDATMHVPLALAPPPPGTPPGTRVRTPVSTADLAASVLERLGLDRAALPDARTPTLPAVEPSLDDSWRDDDRALYLETLTPYFAHRWHPQRAIVWKGLKYIESPRPELYRVADAADPGELTNLLPAEAALGERMATRLVALAQEHAALGWESRGTITSEDASKLAELGYTAAGLDGDPFDPKLPDAKERIGDIAALDAIEKLLFDANRVLKLDVGLRTGRRPPLAPDEQARGTQLLEEARGKLLTIRAANPDDPFLDQIEASIAINTGDFAAAVAPHERALLKSPRNMPLRYNLAVAYANTEHGDWGVREMEKALFVEPRSLQGHRWLVQMSVTRKEWPAAAWWLDELAKLPGQGEGDLANGCTARARVQKELDASGAKPRGPEPVTEAELTPERPRLAAIEAAAPRAGDGK